MAIERKKDELILYVGPLIEIEMKSYRTMIWKIFCSSHFVGMCMRKKRNKNFRCLKKQHQCKRWWNKTEEERDEVEDVKKCWWNKNLSSREMPKCLLHTDSVMRKRRNSITEQMVNLRQPTTASTKATTTTAVAATTTATFFSSSSFTCTD